MSHQTWYATEYDPEEQIFYGYVDTGDQDSEWGNFSLAEMQDLKVKGLGMERDIHFTPQKIGNVSGLQDRFKTTPEPEVRGTFRQDVPIDELVEEKKAAETTTTPEPKAPASKEEETPANPKLEDEFYANMDEGHGFKSIKAKKVVIPGYEKFDLYLHHPASVDKKGEVVEDKDHWGISEGRSGLYLGDDITSPQADWAVDRLKSKLARKMTPDKLEQSVENAIKNTGESPKYETETPIAKMQRQVHEIYNSKLSDFVSNELAHDEAYQNALKHSDPQNIEVELQAAIKRAKGKEVLAKLAESQGSQPSAATKVEEPTHPFIGLYKGKQYESHAVSMYAAQKEIAKRVGARHDYDVSVYAATETEPLAAAIEHEKTQPEETPYIEEGGKATRKSKPSIETQAVAHVQQQIPEEAPIVEGEVKRKSKPSIDNEYGKPVREPSEKVVLTPSEVKTIAAGSADILKEQNEKVKVTKVHDDGDLTVKKGDTNYVVTTEGKTFKEVKPAPELKDAIHTSHELGEKATRGGQEVSRGPHKAEKAGSIPAPATKPPEQPEREGHPISEAENRAIHAWYGEHGESNHGGKKRMSVLTTKQREALPDSAFAIPEERKYPIHDKNHARAALARVAEFGTPEEKQRVAKAIKDRYPEEETLNSYATAKAGGHKIMMTSLKDSPHHPVAPKGSRVSMSNAAPHLTKPHMTRKGRGLTRRSDR